MAVTIQNADVFAEINTTPLIDVMLVLLTLLIITLPLQTHAVRIALPHGTTTQVLTPPPVVLLDVDWDGTPEWNGRPVDRATLDAYLVHAAHQDPQPELHIHADRFAKYDAVALVISDAARLGEKRIVFNNIGLP
jgi:biopolymer transport protein ExbD